MIVLTYIKTDSETTLMPGDEFHLTVTDDFGTDVVIREQITTHKVINFIATYCFALEDGTVPGFHLAGIFGNQDELPPEIQNAVQVNELSSEHLGNFLKTCGKRLINDAGQTVEYDDMFTEKPCHICGAPISKMRDYVFNIDDTFAHKDCQDKRYAEEFERKEQAIQDKLDSKSTLWRKMLDGLKL